MKKYYRVSIVFAALLIVGLMAVNSVAAAPIQMQMLSKASDEKAMIVAIENIEDKVEQLKVPETGIITTLESSRNTAQALNKDIAPQLEVPNDVEQLREQLPGTFAEAKAKIKRLTNRFLMWTHDLRHIMWGHYRNNLFIGKDNLDKRAWGIYAEGIFAGLYDGKFFIGRYKGGRWCARYIFGEPWTWGRYLVYPNPAESTDNAKS